MPLLEEEWEASDENFVAVRISEFYSPRKVAFDLHLKIGEKQYLRIFRAGEDFNETELRAYEADRGIRHVFFDAAYRTTYIKSSLALLQKITPLVGVPTRAKFGVARILSELYMQELFLADDDTRPKLVESGKIICGALGGWLEAEPNLENFLLHLDRIDPSVEELSFLTGVFSVALSKYFPWKSQRTTETLMLSAFLCDLGISALPPELTKLKLKRMTPGQRRQFEQHPEISYLLLSELKGLNENILLIVREHHEYCDGSGYPQGLPVDKIVLLAKVISLAGDLARSASDYLLTPKEAAGMMFPELSEKAFTTHPDLVAKYDGDLLKVFFSMFGDDPKKKEKAA